MSILKIILNDHIKNNYIYLPSVFIKENNIQTVSLPIIIKLRQLNSNQNIFLGWNGGISSKEECVELSSTISKNLNISNGDYVKIFYDDKESKNDSIDKLQLEPLTNYDYKIIEKNSEFLEENLLNQINVVYDGLIFPFMFYDNKLIILKVKLDEKNKDKGFILSGDCEVEVIYKRPVDSKQESIKNYTLKTNIIFKNSENISKCVFKDSVSVKLSRYFLGLESEKLDKLVTNSVCNISLSDASIEGKNFFSNENFLFRFVDKSTINKFFTNIRENKNIGEDEKRYIINSSFLNKLPYRNSIWLNIVIDDNEGDESINNIGVNSKKIITLPEIAKLNTVFFDNDVVDFTVVDVSEIKNIFDNLSYISFIDKYLKIDFFCSNISQSESLNNFQSEIKNDFKNMLIKEILEFVESLGNAVLNLDCFYSLKKSENSSIFFKFYLDCDMKLYTELIFSKLKLNFDSSTREKFTNQPFIIFNNNLKMKETLKNLYHKINFSNELKTIYNYTLNNKTNRHLINLDDDNLKIENSLNDVETFDSFLWKKEKEIIKHDLVCDEHKKNLVKKIKDFYKNKSLCNISMVLAPKEYKIKIYLKELKSKLNSKFSKSNNGPSFVYINLNMFNFNTYNDIETFECYLKSLLKFYTKMQIGENILFVFDGLERFTTSDGSQIQTNQISELVNNSLSYLITKFLNKCRVLNEKLIEGNSFYFIFFLNGVGRLNEVSLDFIHKNSIFDVSKIKFVMKEASKEILNFMLNIYIMGEANLFYDNRKKLLNDLSEYCQNYVISDFYKIYQILISKKNQNTTQNLSESEIRTIFGNYIPCNIIEEKIIKLGVDFSHIGGLAKIKEEIYDTIVLSNLCSEMFNGKLPINLSSGLLLIGPPGCGKTLIASAVQKEFKINFYSIKGPEILNKYIGASEAAIRDIFENAKKTLPCIIFFDEFDSIAPRRGTGSSGVTDRIVNQLLTYLDGIESREGIFVMGATSRPDLIDPAVLRPGRLDKILLCDFPNQDERLDILKLYYTQSQASNEDNNIIDEINLNQSQIDALKFISENTQYYTGADLQSLVYNAFLLSVKRNIEMKKDELPVINASDLKLSFEEFRKSISGKDINFYEDIKNKFLLRLNSFDQSNEIDLTKIDMKTTLY